MDLFLFTSTYPHASPVCSISILWNSFKPLVQCQHWPKPGMLLMMYCMLMSFVPLDLFLHVMLMLILFVLFSFYMLQHLHYHSGGLRLNPNLYTFGTVCPSLLNTWSGSQSEMWTLGKSTMLQVLLSIQALVLNEKPYFNEPGLAPFAGQAKMEKMS